MKYFIITTCLKHLLCFHSVAEKESKSVGKQLSIAYGKLKKCENPVHLYVTSFDENNKTGQAIKRQGCKWKTFLFILFLSLVFCSF